MARLIDVDALRKDFKVAERCDDCPQRNRDCNADTVFSRRDICGMLDDAEIVDAELIVRCKQCKQWDDSSEGRYVGGWCFCDRLQMSTSPDWFCADGEAKHE